MKRLRVVLADDHPQILTLLQTVLESEYLVVGTAHNGQALIMAVDALRPDFVLTDRDMPGMNGIEAMREIHKVRPNMPVIIHSAHSDPEVIAAAFEAGAAGYLIKGSSQSLVSSIRTLVRHVWGVHGFSASSERVTCPSATPASHARYPHHNV
jgi:DNA-binding NarL/FixJ family response regulator